MSDSKHGSARSSNSDVATVSDLIGHGSEAHRLVRVGQWALSAWMSAGGEEPRIRDLVLGKRLGYGRPRDIRPLIERYLQDLPGIYVRGTVSRTSMPRGGTRETVVPEYWLTEEEALFIATKSETPAAVTLTKEMIRVFMLARRGLLPQQASDTNSTAILALLQDQARRLAALENAQAAGVSVQQVAGRGGATTISGKLQEYGRLMAADGSKRERFRWRGRGEMELRGHLKFVGTGSRWGALPIADFHAAMRKLEGMLRMAATNAAARGTPNGVEQGSLFGRQPTARA